MPRIAATRRLAQFVGSYRDRSLPEDVIHQARRLLMNGLAASIAAFDHPSTRVLQRWAQTNPSAHSNARLLWLGDPAEIGTAVVVNGAMMEMLDFNETHIEAYVHPTAPVWPAVQAVAESSGLSVAEALQAAAIGIEVELAVATALMPHHYERGFNPAVAAGAVGAAAGCAVLMRLDELQAWHALGLAALGSSGPLVALGTMAHPYSIGVAARNGMTAAHLAGQGLEAPGDAIDGPNGLLATVAMRDDDKVDRVLSDLGEGWRITGPIAFKRSPTETITQPLLECIAQLQAETTTARSREVKSIRFSVEPIVAQVAADRRTRFGVPVDDLQARFDPAYCAAAAWITGGFGPEQLAEPTLSDPSVLELRERVSFVAEADRSMVGAGLEVIFTDGTCEGVTIDAYRGSATNPLGDEELTGKFQAAAGPAALDPKVLQQIVDAVWTSELSVSSLLDLARVV